MQILVNGKPVLVKSGTTFEYVAENRLFTGADDYTFTIELPLRDCRQNIEVFGHLSRKDVAKGLAQLPCSIQAGRVWLQGMITISEVTEDGLKAQFLRGRSVQNFQADFDEIYLNEMTLPEWPDYATPPTPEQAAYGQDLNAYALPWVNDGSGNIQNEQKWVSVGVAEKLEWAEGGNGLSWMPNLLWLTGKMLEAVGYTYDFAEWEASPLRHVILCNTLPYVWNEHGFAAALPHWTLAEYFEKLELFLGMEISIDHARRTVSMRKMCDAVAAAGRIHIAEVVDEYSVAVDADEQSANYLPVQNVVYADRGDDAWSLDCAPDVSKVAGLYGSTYPYLGPYLDFVRNVRLADYIQTVGFPIFGLGLDYVEDRGTYFLLKRVSTSREEYNATGKRVKLVPRAVNQFGGIRVSDADDAPTVEVDIVPVRIDDTDRTHGPLPFLPLAANDTDTLDEDHDANESSDSIHTNFETSERELLQLVPYRMVKQGSERGDAYYDRMYVALWPGDRAYGAPGNYKPCNLRPFRDNFEVSPDGDSYWVPSADERFSLRLERVAGYAGLSKIDPTQKFTFKFLSDTIPDARAEFVIRGKRYVCESIKATFSEHGMSRLLTGTFYPVPD